MASLEKYSCKKGYLGDQIQRLDFLMKNDPRKRGLGDARCAGGGV